MTEKVGLKAAVELVEGDQEPPEGTATDQMPLWPAAEIEGMPASASVRPVTGDMVPRRGAGRPPGARNKSTTEWVDYLRGRYRSPLEMLAETFSRPAAVLAAELGCSRLEAFKLQILAAKELAPFMHSRMPQALQIEAKSAVHLSIDLGDGQAHRVPVHEADYDLVIESFGTEQNQEVSEGDSSELDSPELDR